MQKRGRLSERQREQLPGKPKVSKREMQKNLPSSEQEDRRGHFGMARFARKQAGLSQKTDP